MFELFASDYGPLMQSDDCLVQVMRKTQDRSELLSLCISESFNHLLINENKHNAGSAQVPKSKSNTKVVINKLLNKQTRKQAKQTNKTRKNQQNL